MIACIYIKCMCSMRHIYMMHTLGKPVIWLLRPGHAHRIQRVAGTARKRSRKRRTAGQRQLCAPAATASLIMKRALCDQEHAYRAISTTHAPGVHHGIPWLDALWFCTLMALKCALESKADGRWQAVGRLGRLFGRASGVAAGAPPNAGGAPQGHGPGNALRTVWSAVPSSPRDDDAACTGPAAV